MFRQHFHEFWYIVTVFGLIETAAASNHRFASPPPTQVASSCRIRQRGGFLVSSAVSRSTFRRSSSHPALGQFVVSRLQAALDLSAISLKNTVVNIRDTRTIKTITDMNKFLNLRSFNCGIHSVHNLKVATEGCKSKGIVSLNIAKARILHGFSRRSSIGRAADL